MGSWTDTILNVQVFAFIGLLIWLMAKPIEPIKPEEDQDQRDSRGDASPRDAD